MFIKRTSLHALKGITVSMEDINTMFEKAPCSFVCREIRKLYAEIQNATPKNPRDGEYWRMIEIIAKVWIAGRTQGIREERARRKVSREVSA